MNKIEKEFLRQAQNDHTLYGPYADWLEEQGRKYDAARYRAKAGLSRIRYIIRKKSDGTQLGEYATIGNTRGQISKLVGRTGCKWFSHMGYADDDLEILVIEWQEREIYILPPVAEKKGKKKDDGTDATA